MSGEIPPELARLANLTGLWLNNNSLSGEIPPELARLANLTELQLSWNQLSGEIPRELTGLANLTVLALEFNRLGGQIPPELGSLANLTELWLSANQLSGEIPPELGRLANLKLVRMDINQLSGEIPPELGLLANLQELWLQDNPLSGRIPPELGGLSSLTSLRINHSQVSGEIPPELGNLANLTDLQLEWNQLSGEIPSEFGRLTSLERLWIHWNQLSGEIPPELVALPSLTDLRIDGNRLTGQIPPRLRRPLPVRVAADGAAPEPSGATIVVALEAVFGGRTFDQPVELGAYPVGPEGDGVGVFVAEREGRILVLHPDGDGAVELLDISDWIPPLQEEHGLLSVALDPRFEATGHLWLYYSAWGLPSVTRLSRLTVDLGDPRRVDRDTELVVLEIPQPTPIHNGGSIRFGPDGMLYLGLGDGGRPNEARRVQSLLGSVIRIDVREASAASPYIVPPDNPFIDVTGARPELWAYGLRNPWRMAFDPVTGALWAGDVGQLELEEINRIEAGGNYGWNVFEGTHCLLPNTGCDPSGTVLPVVEYGHHLGCVVVGGVVYRGDAIPALVGHYLFADFCDGRLWALPPGGGDVVELAVIPQRLSSFGTDASGEVYLLTFGGAILRIVPP